MGDNIFCVYEVAIKPGEMDNFKAVMNEMVKVTQANEPGAMNYEWFISEDGKSCHIYERYVDSAAVMAHSAVLEHLGERLWATVQPTRCTVYGNPDAELKKEIIASGAVILAPIAGFARQGLL
jgi:quinol monooxygenase YgiN